jgi:hypothetical protein
MELNLPEEERKAFRDLQKEHPGVPPYLLFLAYEFSKMDPEGELLTQAEGEEHVSRLKRTWTPEEKAEYEATAGQVVDAVPLEDLPWAPGFEPPKVNLGSDHNEFSPNDERSAELASGDEPEGKEAEADGSARPEDVAPRT